MKCQCGASMRVVAHEPITTGSPLRVKYQCPRCSQEHVVEFSSFGQTSSAGPWIPKIEKAR